MKTKIIIPFIALTLLLAACKKNSNDSTLITEPSLYNLQASKSNSTDLWIGTPKANYGTGTGADSVYLQGSGPWDVLLMKFRFNGTIGKVTLNADQWNYYWLFGEVIIKAKYYLRTDVASSVTVTSYDPATRIMTGTFDLHLTKISGTITTDPQNVDFTNGTFHVQLLQ